MGTMTIPGFTAEASLPNKTGLRFANGSMFRRTTDSVGPAAINLGVCFDIANDWARARDSGDVGLMNFFYGVYHGYGCLG
jgi:hypothetical protein